ncbi:MAG TPA: VOC family protein, partial [Thermoanaerobaculia bacterium]|nr:VOC family protein [Thermoanaerobaculia bacterium]
MSINDEKIQATLAKYVTGIDHVAIAVHNLEESIDFYTKIVGFELVERRETKGHHTAMISAVLKAGPVTFVLLQGTSAES